MVRQGGGATYHDGVMVYVDLIVANLSSIENDFPQTSQLFIDFAKYGQGQSNFGYAELEKDDRLFNLLSQTDKGKIFYEEIREKIPIITVSTSILGDINNIKKVKFFTLSDLEKEPLETLNLIHKAACLDTKASKSERIDFINGLERLNKIFSIKPGFFGLSININQLIEDWIKNKRNSLNIPKNKY